MGPKVRVSAFVTRAREVLLVGQHRRGRTVWLLPGGAVERGEPLPAALEREGWEETGLRVRTAAGPIAVVQSISPDDGRTRHLVQLVFEATLTSGEEPTSREVAAPTPLPKDPAITEARWFGAGELANAELHPPIQQILAGWLDERDADPTAPLSFFFSEPLWARE